MIQELKQTSENRPARDEHGRLLPGNTANPNGRPLGAKDDPIKKATKQVISEYVDKLAQALPEISPILLKKAKEGDLVAIKEVHDRVMGKAPQSMDLTSKGEQIGGFDIIKPKIKDGKEENTIYSDDKTTSGLEVLDR